MLDYRRSFLRGDVLAGVTVAAYTVPQVMAYAGVAGVPAVAGLWTVVPAMAVYALLGSSRQLSVGPESTTALLAAVAIGPLAHGDPRRYAALSAGLAIVVGSMCVIAWLARLGVVADLLSRPVLAGYMAGVAVTMVVSQLERTTGIPVKGTGLIAELSSFLTQLDDVRWPTLGLAASVLIFLLAVEARFPRLPAPLLAVGLAAAVVILFHLDRHGVAIVGMVPDGLPRPRLPILSEADFRDLLLPGIGVMVVGYADNVLTARVFASRRRQQVDANQEFLALGVANVGAGLFRGFPVSSSGSRTALGDAAGSRTQVYSLVAVAIVLAILTAGGMLLK
jgi:MFS superfamily sulfate permease-like transporter